MIRFLIETRPRGTKEEAWTLVTYYPTRPEAYVRAEGLKALHADDMEYRIRHPYADECGCMECGFERHIRRGGTLD